MGSSKKPKKAGTFTVDSNSCLDFKVGDVVGVDTGPNKDWSVITKITVLDNGQTGIEITEYEINKPHPLVAAVNKATQPTIKKGGSEGWKKLMERKRTRMRKSTKMK